MQFYSVQLKKKIDVDEKDVELKTMKNGRKAASAVKVVDGKKIKLYKILSKDDIAKLEKLNK
jgi:hypothetical protein